MRRERDEEHMSSRNIRGRRRVVLSECALPEYGRDSKTLASLDGQTEPVRILLEESNPQSERRPVNTEGGGWNGLSLH